MFKRLYLAASLLLISIPAVAQTAASLCVTGTGFWGPTCNPVSSTNPLPIGVYDSGNNTGYVLTSNGSASVATFQAGGGGGGSSALSAITSATTTNSIANANFAQTWAWATATTQTPLTFSSAALTTGNLLALSNTSTISSGKVLSAINATTSTGYGVYGILTAAVNSGYAGYFSNTATVNGYALYASGLTTLNGAMIGTSGAFSGALTALSLTATTISGVNAAISGTTTLASAQIAAGNATLTGLTASTVTAATYTGGNAALTGSTTVNNLQVTGTTNALTSVPLGAGLTITQGSQNASPLISTSTGLYQQIWPLALTTSHLIGTADANALDIYALTGTSTGYLNLLTAGLAFNGLNTTTSALKLTVSGSGNIVGLPVTSNVASLGQGGFYACVPDGANYNCAGFLGYPIAVANGGTGATTLTQYGVLTGNGTSAVSALTPTTTAGWVLTATATAPDWEPSTGLPTTTTAGSVLIATSTGGWQQSLLTAGSNITITPGSGSIIIAATTTASGNVSLSSVTSATGANTMDNTNAAQIWEWGTLSTGTGLALTSSSLTSGKVLSAAATNVAGTGYAGFFSNTATAGYALYASGALGATSTLTLTGLVAGTVSGNSYLGLDTSNHVVLAAGGGGGTTMVFPQSFNVIEASTTGQQNNIYPNLYTGNGGNASASETGWAIANTVTAANGDPVLAMRIPMPPTIPSGTPKLVSAALAATATGILKYTVSDGLADTASSPSAATLTAETQTSLSLTTTDGYIITKTSLSVTPVANSMMVLAVTANRTGTTVGVPVTTKWWLIWE